MNGRIHSANLQQGSTCQSVAGGLVSMRALFKVQRSLIYGPGLSQNGATPAPRAEVISVSLRWKIACLRCRLFESLSITSGMSGLPNDTSMDCVHGSAWLRWNLKKERHDPLQLATCGC